MNRVKLKFPKEKSLFQAIIPIRITDLNYGNHLGNDQLLSILHEARVQLLQFYGFSETEIFGVSLIMADVMIAYKNEGFYGDVLKIDLYIEDITTRSFDILYKVHCNRKEKPIMIAEAKTGMVCFDYNDRKIQEIPRAFLEKIGKL